jgi:NADH pyrophosphatase NudC (nudix superfamily)
MMDIGAILLLLAVMLVTGVFVIQPFLKSRRPRAISAEEHELSALMAERDRLITAVQELDFDYTLGKIPSEDYPAMRVRLIQNAADVLRNLDTLQAAQSTPADAEEALIAARRADKLKKSALSERGVLQADDDVEALIASRKAARKEKSAGFCAKCGKAILRSDRFCPHCGKPIN